MNVRKIIMIAAGALVLLICIILNIVLLCKDVFHGAYRSSDKVYRSEISFCTDMHFYSYVSGSERDEKLAPDDFGFYECISPDEDNEAEYNTLILESSKIGSSVSFKRNSVFSFTYAPGSEDTVTYTCTTAVFLQVLYGVLILASIIIIVLNSQGGN